MRKLEVLADFMPIDQILQDNEINPIVVLKFLFDEGLIDIEQYFIDNEEEDE